jgi:chemotaxis protein MotB
VVKDFLVRRVLLVLCVSFVTTACGYSQEEWDQKVRENEGLRNQLAAQKQAHEKCESDYAAALHEVEDLRGKLRDRGVNLDNLSQSLADERRALEEFKSRAEQLEQIRKRFETLRDKLAQLANLGLKVEVRENRMLIDLPGDVLFDSGSDKLKPRGKEILTSVAAVVRNDADLSKRQFQVAGHTDNKPLKGGPFQDNFGLSAMRARSVLAFLTAPTSEGGGGLDAKHWSAAGYGETDPVANNDTDEGRARNRRVELVVVPDMQEMLNLNSLAK